MAVNAGNTKVVGHDRLGALLKSVSTVTERRGIDVLVIRQDDVPPTARSGLNCPHRLRNWVGARENRLQIERTSSRWINRLSSFLPRLHPLDLSSFSAHGRFHRCKIGAGESSAKNRQAGSWIGDSSFQGSRCFCRYLETPRRKERFCVTTELQPLVLQFGCIATVFHAN